MSRGLVGLRKEMRFSLPPPSEIALFLKLYIYICVYKKEKKKLAENDSFLFFF